jgi:thioredoxin-related protein
MKRIFFAITIILLSICNSYAQEWITNFDEARQIAADSNKTIVMVFQGSDWCAPCIKLDREIWSSEVFKQHARNHYVMLQVDFPRRKQNRLSKAQQDHNNQLAEKYNDGAGFPLVVLLDDTGAVLGKCGYENITPKAYIDLLKSLENTNE